MKSDRLEKAIQFSHPGGEHKEGKIINGTNLYFKEWNKGKHQRKYVRQIGDYINCSGERIENQPIDFWCEWEAESIVKKAVGKECSYNNQFPENIHYPIFIPKTERVNNVLKFENENYDLKSGENTDPFVFGDEFYFTCCKENVKKKLDKGSLILFGSTVIKGGKRFMIDTVFVVRDIYECGSAEYRNLSKNKIFKETVLDLLGNSCSESDDDTILVGATYDKPHNGMYGFFPCHQSTDKDSFERLIVDKDVHMNITDYVQNIRNIVINDETEIKKVWDNIVNCCIERGYFLGIKAELPQEIKIKSNTFDVKGIVNSIDNQIRQVNIK